MNPSASLENQHEQIPKTTKCSSFNLLLVSISFQLYIQVNHICGCILRADWLVSLRVLSLLTVRWVYTACHFLRHQKFISPSNDDHEFASSSFSVFPFLTFLRRHSWWPVSAHRKSLCNSLDSRLTATSWCRDPLSILTVCCGLESLKSSLFLETVSGQGQCLHFPWVSGSPFETLIELHSRLQDVFWAERGWHKHSPRVLLQRATSLHRNLRKLGLKTR